MTLIDHNTARQFDRLPPHDIPAEQCVLASLMIAAGEGATAACAEIRGTVTRDDFFQADHQVIYDVLWLSPLERREPLGAAISLTLLAAVIWGLCAAMSGRAAYIHVGSLFGTIMAANVWMRILPAQRKMVGALERGEPIDDSIARLGERAKQLVQPGGHVLEMDRPHLVPQAQRVRLVLGDDDIGHDGPPRDARMRRRIGSLPRRRVWLVWPTAWTLAVRARPCQSLFVALPCGAQSAARSLWQAAAVPHYHAGRVASGSG